MWVKVDDAFPTHHKVFIAGHRLGPHGRTQVLALWLEALCWTNRHQKEGFLPMAVVEVFQHVAHPLRVAAALEQAGIWEAVDGGWQIHNWAKYQIKGDRQADLVKARSDAGRRGALAKHGKRLAKSGNALANVWQTSGKICPVPDPKDQELSRAREQPLPPPLRGKGKYHPKVKGAWSCAHTPPHGNYQACIAQTLADAKKAPS